MRSVGKEVMSTSKEMPGTAGDIFPAASQSAIALHGIKSPRSRMDVKKRIGARIVQLSLIELGIPCHYCFRTEGTLGYSPIPYALEAASNANFCQQLRKLSNTSEIPANSTYIYQVILNSSVHIEAAKSICMSCL